MEIVSFKPISSSVSVSGAISMHGEATMADGSKRIITLSGRTLSILPKPTDTSQNTSEEAM